METQIKRITEQLESKAVLKQEIYKITLNAFNQLKQTLNDLAHLLSEQMEETSVNISYQDKSTFEAEIEFGGDTLIFTMHTNVFSFPDGYSIYDSAYVKQEPDRAYCGMIEIYNFLSDSFKYKRLADTGYLTARIFINKDNHFFIEGEEQLRFLYKDFDNLVFTKEVMCLIIEKAILHSIGFDLWVPKYADVREITVREKLMESATHKTAKRLGFDFSNISSKQEDKK